MSYIQTFLLFVYFIVSGGGLPSVLGFPLGVVVHLVHLVDGLAAEFGEIGAVVAKLIVVLGDGRFFWGVVLGGVLVL